VAGLRYYPLPVCSRIGCRTTPTGKMHQERRLDSLQTPDILTRFGLTTPLWLMDFVSDALFDGRRMQALPAPDRSLN